MGEVDRPLAGTVVPFLDVPCNGRGGGECEPEMGELPWKGCFEEPLSGILDKRLKTSPGIADTKVISVVTCRYQLGR